jgi:hypothetical protein
MPPNNKNKRLHNMPSVLFNDIVKNLRYLRYVENSAAWVSEEEDDAEDEATNKQHAVSVLADLVCEDSKNQIDRPTALRGCCTPGTATRRSIASPANARNK